MVHFPTGEGNVSLLQRAHTLSGTHPTSHSVGTVVIRSGLRGQGREANLSPPSGTSMELHHFALCHVMLGVVSN